MSLILRRDKGTALTMDELDDNLEYLEQDGGGGGVKSLHYIAALDQLRTDAPVATVIRNDFDGEIVWSRVDVGKYLATLTGIGIGNIRIIPPNTTISAEPGQKYLVTACGVNNDNEVYLSTSLVDSDTGIGTLSDGDPDVGEGQTTLEGVGYSYIEIIKYL